MKLFSSIHAVYEAYEMVIVRLMEMLFEKTNEAGIVIFCIALLLLNYLVSHTVAMVVAGALVVPLLNFLIRMVITIKYYD